MAEILNTETITELDAEDIGPQSWLLHSDTLGNAFKESYLSFLVKLNAIYGTKQEVFDINAVLPKLASLTYVNDKNTQIYALIDQIAKGSLNVFPTDTPTPKIDSYVAMVAGTYTKFGNIVVTQAEITSGIVQLNRAGSVWTKKVLTVPTLPNTIPTPSNETFDII